MYYEIPEENMEQLEKKLKTISNKCKKFGCEFNYFKIGEVFRDVVNGRYRYSKKFYCIEAEGKAEINGWKFVASLEHTDKGNIIRGISDIEVPQKYYDVKATCEHCNISRNRKETYLIYNEEKNEFKQVGKACLKDYTGGMCAEQVSKMLSYIETLKNAQYGDNGDSSRIKKYYQTEDILKYASETVLKFGYVKTCEENNTSYRTMVFYDIINKGYSGGLTNEEIEIYKDELEKSEFDPDSAEAVLNVSKALNWLDEQESSNNYLHNLKLICTSKYITYREFGILVSLFPSYFRYIQNEARKKEIKKNNELSNFVGEIKERINIIIDNVICLTSWETEWGHTYLYKFTDVNGNILTWKTSNFLNIREEIKNIKGTVKAHNIYNETKQTELTRVKII